MCFPKEDNSPCEKHTSKAFGLLSKSGGLTIMNIRGHMNIVNSLVCELKGFLLAKDSIFCLLFVFNKTLKFPSKTGDTNTT